MLIQQVAAGSAGDCRLTAAGSAQQVAAGRCGWGAAAVHLSPLQRRRPAVLGVKDMLDCMRGSSAACFTSPPAWEEREETL